jgi:hypothetical protein
VELGVLETSEAAAAAAAAAGSAGAGFDARAGDRLAAWPLDVGAEMEYEAGPAVSDKA